MLAAQFSSTKEQGEVHPWLSFDGLLALGQSPKSLTLVRSLCRQVYDTKVQMVFVQR